MPTADAPTWHARLELELAKRGAGTRVTRCRHKGPLYVQKAFYPEGDDLAHVYLLHPPGGVVSGDHLDIEISVDTHARGLVTTPGAARIYRARDTRPMQRQTVTLNVAQGASIEWFPLETIVFNGACVELDTTINLAPDSHFCGWELTCFGLSSVVDAFQHGTFRQRYKIMREDRPAFIERLEVTPENLVDVLHGSASFQGERVSGVFVAGPMPCQLDEDMLLTLRQASNTPNADISQVGDFLVGRYLGSSAEQGRQAFTAWWQHLRPQLIDRQACAPRIWLT